MVFIKSESKSPKTCPVKNCNGLGHKKWYKYDKHTKKENCPYAQFEYEPLDRDSDVNESSDEEGDAESEEDKVLQNEFSGQHENINKPLDEEHVDAFNNCTYTMIKQENKFFSQKEFKNLIHNYKQLTPHDVTVKDVMTWNYDQVEKFVLKLTNCPTTAEIFSEEVTCNFLCFIVLLTLTITASRWRIFFDASARGSPRPTSH